ncbi:c-type cytochrome [Nitrogeniibacter aestuarii]|uniref:c-type cytochrome n=1 Tax=Nitrogeniibacter aestuarii TaxID=2815343 RepID=UPI001E4EE561|nr:cytochrome c [Nitrogeniibacter aestuarii]
MTTHTTHSRWRVLLAILGITVLVAAAGAVYGWFKFFREVPQPAWITEDPHMRFKYGSIGAENDAGIPYWIFYVLPRVFPDKLPGPGGYASFGVAWEQGMELPVGFTKKTIGFERVANTCAVCHTASYRTTEDSNPVFVPTGPNHTLDLAAFFRFLIDCAKDPRFEPDVLMREINLVTDLSWDDALIYRYLLIPITKKRLLERQTQFAWLYHPAFPDWGRGRDDSMNLTKYFMIQWPMDESFGPTDMPSIWNLGKYQPEKGHRMNFAGDSHNARSVVIDSALGLLGAPPKRNEDFLAQVAWMLDYLKAARAPAYPFPISTVLAEQGKTVFDANCAQCHASARTGTVVPVEEVGTSRDRMDTWNEKAAAEANAVVTEMGIEREGLVEAPLRGYVAAFLDGIWLRAPYLHNGSVPTLADLLKPAAERPVTFWRGYNLYDPVKVGYVTSGSTAEYEGSLHDTRLKGGGNQGHEFGIHLADEEKSALIEYLKTL